MHTQSRLYLHACTCTRAHTYTYTHKLHAYTCTHAHTYTHKSHACTEHHTQIMRKYTNAQTCMLQTSKHECPIIFPTPTQQQSTLISLDLKKNSAAAAKVGRPKGRSTGLWIPIGHECQSILLTCLHRSKESEEEPCCCSQGGLSQGKEHEFVNTNFRSGLMWRVVDFWQSFCLWRVVCHCLRGFFIAQVGLEVEMKVKRLRCVMISVQFKDWNNRWRGATSNKQHLVYLASVPYA